MLAGKFLYFFFSNGLVLLMRHNWRASLEKFRRLVLLVQLFPVAQSVIFLLVVAKYNFASVSML